MRPVNLIPKERPPRRAAGDRSSPPTRSSASLPLVLGAVSLLAIFDKRTSERKVEISSLESQVAVAQAEASSLSSFTSFQQVHDARVQTIDSLARSPASTGSGSCASSRS